MDHHIQKISEKVAGGSAMIVGGGGTMYQAVTDTLSLVALCLNILLAAAGLYVTTHKIFDKRRDRRETDEV